MGGLLWARHTVHGDALKLTAMNELGHYEGLSLSLCTLLIGLAALLLHVCVPVHEGAMSLGQDARPSSSHRSYHDWRQPVNPFVYRWADTFPALA